MGSLLLLLVLGCAVCISAQFTSFKTASFNVYKPKTNAQKIDSLTGMFQRNKDENKGLIKSFSDRMKTSQEEINEKVTQQKLQIKKMEELVSKLGQNNIHEKFNDVKESLDTASNTVKTLKSKVNGMTEEATQRCLQTEQKYASLVNNIYSTNSDSHSNAVQGLTTQSSQADASSGAMKAIDNNPNTCSKTLRETDAAWWQVDEKRRKSVIGVAVTLPEQPTGNYKLLSDFEIHVYETRPSACLDVKYTVCKSSSSINDGRQLTLTCDTPVSGRFVRISKKNGGVLSLCEVDIMTA